MVLLLTGLRLRPNAFGVQGIQDRTWQIQACSAKTGEGLQEGLLAFFWVVFFLVFIVITFVIINITIFFDLFFFKKKILGFIVGLCWVLVLGRFPRFLWIFSWFCKTKIFF